MKKGKVLSEARQEIKTFTSQDYGRVIAQRNVTISSVAAMGLMLGASTAQAAQINVTAGGPVDNVVNGNCSLVEAVVAANTNGMVDQCAAGDDATNGGDEVVIPAGSIFNFPNNAGTFAYALGPARAGVANPAPPVSGNAAFALPPIISNVVITGNESTINGGAPGAPRFALATVAGGGSLQVSGSTISGFDGEMGGALDAFFGTLTVTGSTVSGNAGVLGGGIYAMAPTNVINSTISGNNAYTGGGLYNFGANLTITASTISGNTANGDPTALPPVPGTGGGIDQYDNFGGFGATVITNSTVSGNTATYGSGIAHWNGAVTLVSTTVSGNIHSAPLGNAAGGASYGQAAVNTFGGLTLTNSILANTTSANGSTVSDCYVSQSSPVPTFNGVNIIKTDSTVGAAGPGTAGGASNCDPGQANALHADPMLSPLAVNGAVGSTQSHAPAAGSPAIDAVPAGQCNDSNAAVLGADQNGTARPIDGDTDGTPLCDVGSVEAAAAPPPNQCANGVDDDNDGLADAADTNDCQGNDVTENTTQCNDGADNDLDGNADGADANDCAAGDVTEATTQCNDGLDNDADGMPDGLDVNDCQAGDITEATTQCNDGLDNDGDGLGDALDPNDCQAGDITEDMKAANPPPAANTCADGIDNDGDGAADAADVNDCQGNDVTEDTKAAAVVDTDGDGVSDANEPGDANGDNIPDAAQANVASKASASGTGAIVIESPAGNPISAVNVAAVATVPTGFTMPDGMVGFTVNNVPVGGTVNVKVTLPTAPNAYFKFDNTGNATQVDTGAAPIAVINGNTVTLTLTDGQAPGDIDGAANGMIVDPGAGAQQQFASGGGGGCAVADKPSRLDPLMPALLGLAGFFLFWRRQKG